jgi:hypothetical protein
VTVFGLRQCLVLDSVWSYLFCVFLRVRGPILDMVQRNGWLEPNREAIRKGFRLRLKGLRDYNALADKGFSRIRIEWGNQQGTPCFKNTVMGCEAAPENVLRCLRIANVEQPVAHRAVEEVFKTRSLIPFCNALLSESDPKARKHAVVLPYSSKREESLGNGEHGPNSRVVRFRIPDPLLYKAYAIDPFWTPTTEEGRPEWWPRIELLELFWLVSL